MILENYEMNGDAGFEPTPRASDSRALPMENDGLVSHEEACVSNL
jgi:hypothetical protein